MLKQLSIYAENRKGTMQHITELLRKSDVNILGSVTNDSAEYGIIRMVVSDTDAAVRELTGAGYLCRTTFVIGVEIDDHPGALDELLKALYNSNVDVNYLYLSFDRDSAMPIIVLHTEDIPEVEACLESKGFVCKHGDVI
ncbi:MAG: amino acid-binding protein [Blautia sp.]|nr:amino acid-binding protein [Blautia sp.]